MPVPYQHLSREESDFQHAPSRSARDFPGTLQRHAAETAALHSAPGLSFHMAPGRDHFDILDELADPDSVSVRALMAMA